MPCSTLGRLLTAFIRVTVDGSLVDSGEEGVTAIVLSTAKETGAIARVPYPWWRRCRGGALISGLRAAAAVVELRE